MLPELQVNALVLTVAVVWAVLLILQGVPVTADLAHPYSTACGILVLLLAAFDNWLWHIPVLQGSFVKRPYLGGTWRVEFQTSWIDPSTGNTPGPLAGFMIVRQTYSDITMTFFTRESSSQFVADELTVGPDGRFVVFAVYQNEPKAQVRHRSPIHYGALKMIVQGSPPTGIEGVYWTDRLTRGDIRLFDRRYSRYDTFEAAATAYGID